MYEFIEHGRFFLTFEKDWDSAIFDADELTGYKFYGKAITPHDKILLSIAKSWEPFLVRGLLETDPLYTKWRDEELDESRLNGAWDASYLQTLGRHLTPEYQATYLVNLAEELALWHTGGVDFESCHYISKNAGGWDNVWVHRGYYDNRSYSREARAASKKRLASFWVDREDVVRVIKDILDLASFYLDHVEPLESLESLEKTS